MGKDEVGGVMERRGGAEEDGVGCVVPERMYIHIYMYERSRRGVYGTWPGARDRRRRWC